MRKIYEMSEKICKRTNWPLYKFFLYMNIIIWSAFAFLMSAAISVILYGV